MIANNSVSRLASRQSGIANNVAAKIEKRCPGAVLLEDVKRSARPRARPVIERQRDRIPRSSSAIDGIPQGQQPRHRRLLIMDRRSSSRGARPASQDGHAQENERKNSPAQKDPPQKVLPGVRFTEAHHRFHRRLQWRSGVEGEERRREAGRDDLEWFDRGA